MKRFLHKIYTTCIYPWVIPTYVPHTGFYFIIQNLIFNDSTYKVTSNNNNYFSRIVICDVDFVYICSKTPFTVKRKGYMTFRLIQRRTHKCCFRKFHLFCGPVTVCYIINVSHDALDLYNKVYTNTATPQLPMI